MSLKKVEIETTLIDKHNDLLYKEKDFHKKNTGKKKDGWKTFKSKCKYALKNLTFEPPTILFVLSSIIQIMTTQNLALEKACRVNLNYTDEICSSLKMQQNENYKDYEREVQMLLARGIAWKTFLVSLVPAAMALFIGSWSDKTGHRKCFVLIPIIGQLFMSINNMLNTYFFLQLNMEFLIFSEAALEGLSGSWSIYFMTINSHISAVTTEKTRTFRLGLVNFCFTVGFPIGMAIGGTFLKRLGYFGCYAVSSASQVINLLYCIFLVKDPKRTTSQKRHDNRGVGHFFRTFFDLANVKDTVVVVFKNGPGKRRTRMIVLLLVVTILYGPMFGEVAVLYLSTRYRFNWDEVNFSLFQSYNFMVHTIGTIFSITVLSRVLQWHDSMLGIISTVSKIAASFVYCFAPTDTIFYIGPVVEILSGTSLLAVRSIVSKLVAANELGKVNSIFGLTENLMPLVYVPLYTKMYSATMEVLPGAVFLVGGAMTFPAVIVFIILFVEHRVGLKKKQQNDAIDVATPLTG